MTPLFRSRQRAEEFAALVDGVQARERSERSSAELEPLAGVVTLLRTHDDEQSLPRAEFSADLRERLMTEAATALTPQAAKLRLPERTHGKRERRLVAAATAAVLLGGTAGVAAASEDALPGEALYPIKRAIERADAGLSTSSAGRGQDMLDQASSRLDEVSGLSTGGSAAGAAQIPATLQDFTEQAQQGADLMIESYEDGGQAEDIEKLREFTAADLEQLEGLVDQVPAAAQPDLRAAAEALQAIDEQATEVCGDCADLPPLELSSAFTAVEEAERAMRSAGGGVGGLDDNPTAPKTGPPVDSSPDRSAAPSDKSSAAPSSPSQEAPSTGAPEPSTGPGGGGILPSVPGLPDVPNIPGGSGAKNDDPKVSPKPVEDLVDDTVDDLDGLTDDLLP